MLTSNCGPVTTARRNVTRCYGDKRLTGALFVKELILVSVRMVPPPPLDLEPLQSGFYGFQMTVGFLVALLLGFF